MRLEMFSQIIMSPISVETCEHILLDDSRDSHTLDSTKYQLPFDDNSFDLVRMANLTLCVPKSKWTDVLFEVRRVLKIGGRLELIDDEIFFPLILPTPGLLHQRSVSQRSVSVKQDPLFPYDNSGPSDEESDYFNTGSSQPSRKHSTDSRDLNVHIIDSKRLAREEYERNSDTSRGLESIFKDMLKELGIFQPTFENLLGFVFGHENAAELDEFQLSVPSRGFLESEGNVKKAQPRRPRRSDGAVDLLRDDGQTQPATPSLSPKAVRLLLGDPLIKSSRDYLPFQPPGLILLSSGTLLDFPPAELEMHACKNLHVLLSCKHALMNFMLNQKQATTVDERNELDMAIREADLEDCFWIYERCVLVGSCRW